ncbi:similar to ferric iron reductase protein fhuF [Rhodopirellula baltica SH 1]|uniref:Similar to ferric iron reductase protein fhuF n=1 Tax=Rhodopirellula baltica (strain DSM 10527 / NCIMB 13988 / SH1) TaxID=243090 RepID=Q7ULX0_RHOBA|nr:similar to ferric iron reductase protein fhuF [Rhodopirellula baltica SH 1]
MLSNLGIYSGSDRQHKIDFHFCDGPAPMDAIFLDWRESKCTHASFASIASSPAGWGMHFERDEPNHCSSSVPSCSLWQQFPTTVGVPAINASKSAQCRCCGHVGK